MQDVKSVGILVDDLGLSQLNFYLINHINYLAKTRMDIDPILFFKNVNHPCIRPHCATLNMCDIWSFNGTIIATNLDSALTALNAVNNADNILYLWDLEWLRGKNNYLYNLSILRHPDLRVIARSVHHAQAIENYANIKVHKVVNDINLLGIIE